ncbi:MAG: hypothetical protein NTX86_05780 [Candidatus Dependentiae bacterium]|nr:hypothetical protein [Candidatus Dependentiae bacterium]
MKLNYTMALLLLTLGVNSIITAKNGCNLSVENNSASTIWLSNDALLDNKASVDTLRNHGDFSIKPHRTKPVGFLGAFAIYTRVAHSNNQYQRHYTVVPRDCKNEDLEISLSDLEQGALDPEDFIVIDHTKHYDIPESIYPLCPGGTRSEWDEQSGQWYCKVYRPWQSGTKMYEYIPVYSYIFEWLPNWVLVEWYAKNPHFYGWYDKHTEFWQHLANYQAPWKTASYKQWLAKLPPEQHLEYHKPAKQAVHSTINTKKKLPPRPLGVEPSKVKIVKKQLPQGKLPAVKNKKNSMQ